jgi:TatD DNase family protein
MSTDDISQIIIIGCDRQSSESALALAEKFKDFYCSVGVHPHDAVHAKQDDYQYFESVANNNKLVAIGEIGLDYHYNFSPQAIQRRVLEQQIELAASLKLPIIIHLREAYDDMKAILFQNQHYLRHGLVLHCYSGSIEFARECLKLDSVYFSFGGSITFKNTDRESVVKSLPLDRLLLETDCPYMTPVPYRGKTNYPKYIKLVAQKLSEWLPNIDISELTSNNAHALFKRLNQNNNQVL